MTRFHNFQPRRSEAGVILIMFTIAVFVLFGFLGLSLDASYMYFQKRRMQTAADAGAYAGALELLRGGSSNVTTAARKDTQLNGFQNGTSNITVTVNNPPTTGSKAGNANFVEVIITQPQSTWFMQALSVNSATVSARAVAGLGSTGNGCVYALNPNAGTNNGFSANGTSASNFSCGVYSNSNFRSVGTADVCTPSISYTGTYDNHSAACSPSIGQGVPFVDPLQGRYSIPSYSTCTYSNYHASNGTVALTPGTYCGGININGSVSSVTFAAGDYIMVGGGLRISSGSVSGTGVTIWNTYPGTQMNQYNGISITGSGAVTLSAPTSGTNRGLLFYQDPRVTWASNNGSTITGGSGSVYDGIFYFPTTDLTYAGNSSTTSNGTDGYTVLIAYNVAVQGTANVNTDFSALGGYNPLQNALFAE